MKKDKRKKEIAVVSVLFDELAQRGSGKIFDVVLDLRPQSASFLNWEGVELSADNYKAIYIPEGCAHGFLTLADGSEVLYQMSEPYHPESAAGVRWDDPAFDIEWPSSNVIISDRDKKYELWDDTA